MILAVVAFPRLEEADRQWIESVRSRHDPQVARLGVHFTLVFPAEAAERGVRAEVAGVARSTAAFAFAVRRVETVEDFGGRSSHVFLVPDEGAAEITALHERLHAGALRVHRRPGLPFVPHMTIGAAADSVAALAVAREIEGRLGSLRGAIDALELLDVGGPRARSLATYDLAPRDRTAVPG